MGQFLELPGAELSRLADVQRRQELKRRIDEPPSPLFRDFRDFLLRTCEAVNRAEVGRIFEKEPFGDLERMVAQTILAVAQSVAREELRDTASPRSKPLASGHSSFLGRHWETGKPMNNHQA